MKVSLDTNVFLAVKNKEPEHEYCEKIINSIEDKQIDGVMSTIVLVEVLVGFYQNTENEEANRFSSKALLNYELVPVNQKIAQEAAQICAQYSIKLPDVIISASTILSGSDFFITRDKNLLKKLRIQKLAPKEFVNNFLDDEKEKT